MSPLPAPRTFSAGEQLDRFRLERMLGKGAFGQVWLAVDEGAFGFQKHVALKILLDIDNPRRVDALIREARICGGLRHPNVIDVYGVGQTDGAVFIVMEFVEGETLAALWKDLDFLGVRFPRSVVCDLGIAVAEALHHAWTANDAQGRPLGVVHRDLKPANIMVSNRGIAKVGDFGVAKALPEPSYTFTGKLKGTPSYLAPEVWQGTREFRPTLDLFSLGVVLWELVVGRRFYANARITEIFEIVSRRSPVEEAANVRPMFPALGDLVERLLQRDPAARPQSAFEVAEQLRAVRIALPPAGDLLQFVRLVRAGRVEPLDRHASIAALPVFLMQAEDWLPLLNVASGTGGRTDESEVVPPEPLGGAVVNLAAPTKTSSVPEALALQDAEPVRELAGEGLAWKDTEPSPPSEPVRAAPRVPGDAAREVAGTPAADEPPSPPRRSAPSDPKERTFDGVVAMRALRLPAAPDAEEAAPPAAPPPDVSDAADASDFPPPAAAQARWVLGVGILVLVGILAWIVSLVGAS